MSERGLSNKMTVIGLVNGMIGGIILVMPILALNTGSLLIAPITLISAFFSYFSSLLCLRHLRNHGDLDQSILKHFGNDRRYKIFYDVIIVISFFALLILYFGLMSDMWYGMIEQTRLIPIINAFVLFPIVYIMKKFHFGASLLAYGILSIVGYCIFLAWMWGAAPSGPKTVPLADSKFVQLAAALAQGFAIQTFFIPILKQNPNRQNYGKLLFITYAIGCLVYMYIGYSGSQSIVNLPNMSTKEEPQEIGDFFGHKQWQVITVQVIYLVHLYSAYPQFLLISKKRFFSIFKWPETDDVTFKQVIYVAVVIFVCLAIKLLNVSPQILIQLNGSIVSFFFIYVIPISLHIKCVYYTNPEDRHVKFQDQVQDNKQIQMVNKSHKENDNKYSDHNLREINEKQQNIQKIDISTNDRKQNLVQQGQKQGVNQNAQQYTSCEIGFKSKKHEICQIVVMVIMVMGGLFTMGFTIYQLIQEHINHNNAQS